MAHFRWVLNALRHTGLTFNLKKSKLGQQMVRYLGFCIGQGRVWAIPDNVAAFREVPLHPHKEKPTEIPGAS